MKRPTSRARSTPTTPTTDGVSPREWPRASFPSRPRSSLCSAASGSRPAVTRSSSRPERRSGTSARPRASIGRSRSPATTAHPSCPAACWPGAAMQRGRSKPGRRRSIRRRLPIRSSLRLRCAPTSVRCERAIADRTAVLLDSRATTFFQGSAKSPQALRPGRLPGAVQLDHVAAFDSTAMALKPKAELATAVRGGLFDAGHQLLQHRPPGRDQLVRAVRGARASRNIAL